MVRDMEKAADAHSTTPYVLVGEEEGVRRLVARFYDLMNNDPAAAEIRAMHSADLAPVREKLFAFLSGWLGARAFIARTPMANVLSRFIRIS